MKIIQITRYGIIILLSSLLISCGNQTEAEVGSVIIISPSSINWTVGAGGCSGTYPGTGPTLQIHRISLVDPFGVPLGNTEFQVSMILTENSALGAVAWAIVDLNEDGRWDNWDFDAMTYDAGPEVITLQGNPVPYTLETNDQGWLDIGILVDLGGCEFSGYLLVTSGIISEILDFDVTVM